MNKNKRGELEPSIKKLKLYLTKLHGKIGKQTLITRNLNRRPLPAALLLREQNVFCLIGPSKVSFPAGSHVGGYTNSARTLISSV